MPLLQTRLHRVKDLIRFLYEARVGFQPSPRSTLRRSKLFLWKEMSGRHRPEARFKPEQDYQRLLAYYSCVPGYYLEAEVGIEPTHRAFAEPCLTTWLLRRKKAWAE